LEAVGTVFRRLGRLVEINHNRKEKGDMRGRCIFAVVLMLAFVFASSALFASWQYSNAFNLVPPESGSSYGDSIPGYYSSDYSTVGSWGYPGAGIRSDNRFGYSDVIDNESAFLRLDLKAPDGSQTFVKAIKLTIWGNSCFDPNEDLLPIDRDAVRSWLAEQGVPYVSDTNMFYGVQFYNEEGVVSGSDPNMFDNIDLYAHPEVLASDTVILGGDTLVPSSRWSMVYESGGWKRWEATFVFEINHMIDREPEGTGLPFHRFWVVLRANRCHNCGENSIEGISNEDEFYLEILDKNDVQVFQEVSAGVFVQLNMDDQNTDVYHNRDFDIPGAAPGYDPAWLDVPGWIPGYENQGRWARSEKIYGVDGDPTIYDIYPVNEVSTNGPNTDPWCDMINEEPVFTADSVQPVVFKAFDTLTCVDSVMVEMRYLNTGTFIRRIDTVIFVNPLTYGRCDTMNGGPGTGWKSFLIHRHRIPPSVTWTRNATPSLDIYPEASVAVDTICGGYEFTIEVGAPTTDDYLPPFDDGAHVQILARAFNRSGSYVDTTWDFIVDLSGPTAVLDFPEEVRDEDTREYSSVRYDNIEGVNVRYRFMPDSLPVFRLRLDDGYLTVHDTYNHGTRYSSGADLGSGINWRDFEVTFIIERCVGMVDTLYVTEADIGSGVYIDEDDATGEWGYMYINFADLYDPVSAPDWFLDSGDKVYVILTELYDDPDYGMGAQDGGVCDTIPTGSECAIGGADGNYGTRSGLANGHIPLNDHYTACMGTDFAPDTLGIVRIDYVGPTFTPYSLYPPLKGITSDTFQIITLDVYDRSGCYAYDTSLTALADHAAGIYAMTTGDSALYINIKVQAADGHFYGGIWGDDDGRNFPYTAGVGPIFLDESPDPDIPGVRITFSPEHVSGGSYHFHAGDKVSITVFVWDNSYPGDADFDTLCDGSAVPHIDWIRNHAAGNPYPPCDTIARWNFFVDIDPPVVAGSNIPEMREGSCNDTLWFDIEDINDGVVPEWSSPWIPGVLAVDVRLTVWDAETGTPTEVDFEDVGYATPVVGTHALRGQELYAILIPQPEVDSLNPYRVAKLLISPDGGGCRFYLEGDSVEVEIWAGDAVNVPYYAASVGTDHSPLWDWTGYLWNHSSESFWSTVCPVWRHGNHTYVADDDRMYGHSVPWADYENPNWTKILGPGSLDTLGYYFTVERKVRVSKAEWFNDSAMMHYGYDFVWPTDLHGEYTMIGEVDTTDEDALSEVGAYDEFVGSWAKDLNFVSADVVSCLGTFLYYECEDWTVGLTPYAKVTLYRDGSELWSHEEWWDPFASWWITYTPDRNGCEEIGHWVIGPMDQLGEYRAHADTIIDTISVEPLVVDTTYQGWQDGDSLVVMFSIHELQTDSTVYRHDYRWWYKFDYQPPTARFTAVPTLTGYEEVNCVDHEFNNAVRLRLEAIRDGGVGIEGDPSVPDGWATEWPARAVVPNSDYIMYYYGTGDPQPALLEYEPHTHYAYSNEELYIENCAEPEQPGQMMPIRLTRVYTDCREMPAGVNEYTVDTVFVADSLYAVVRVQDKLGNVTEVASRKIALDNGSPRVKGVALSTYDAEIDSFIDWDNTVFLQPWTTSQESLVAIYNLPYARSDTEEVVYGWKVYFRIWFDDNMDMRDPDPTTGYMVRFRPEGWTSWLPVIPVDFEEMGTGRFVPYPLAADQVAYDYYLGSYKHVPGDGFTLSGIAEESSMSGYPGWNTDREWIGYTMIADSIMDGVGILRIQGFDDNAGNLMIPYEMPIRIVTRPYEPAIWSARVDTTLTPSEPVPSAWAGARDQDRWVASSVTSWRGDSLKECGVVCSYVDSSAIAFWSYQVDWAITDDVTWKFWWTDEYAEGPSTAYSGPPDFTYTLDDPLDSLPEGKTIDWVTVPRELLDFTREYYHSGVRDTIECNESKYMHVIFEIHSRFYTDEVFADSMMNYLITNREVNGAVRMFVTGGMRDETGTLIRIPSFGLGATDLTIEVTGPAVRDIDAIRYMVVNEVTGDSLQIFPDSGFAYIGLTPGLVYTDTSIQYVWTVPDTFEPGLYSIHIRGFDRITVIEDVVNMEGVDADTFAYILVNNEATRIDIAHTGDPVDVYVDVPYPGGPFETSYETSASDFTIVSRHLFIHPFCLNSDELDTTRFVQIPFHVTFVRGADFESAMAARSECGPPYPDEWGLNDSPLYPAWVRFADGMGPIDVDSTIVRLQVTTFNDWDRELGDNPFEPDYLEQGGYMGDSLYLIFNLGAAPSIDSVHLIIEDEDGGNISGSNFRRDLWLTPAEFLRSYDGSDYFVYYWNVEDQDNRYDGPVKIVTTVYQTDASDSIRVTTSYSFLILDTDDPDYEVTLLRERGTADEVGRVVYSDVDSLVGEEIWVVNADTFNIRVKWLQTIHDESETAEDYITYDDAIFQTRYWDFLRMTIDGQPSGVHVSDPNDVYQVRIWNTSYTDGAEEACWTDIFDNNIYNYQWPVAADPAGNGLGVIMIQGRDAAGNILTYDEARETSHGHGRFFLIDTEAPVLHCENLTASPDGITATGVVAEDNMLGEGFFDAAHYEETGEESYLFLEVFEETEDTSWLVDHVDTTFVPDTACTITAIDTTWEDTIIVSIDTTWDCYETGDTTMYVDTVWVPEVTPVTNFVDTIWLDEEGRFDYAAEVLHAGATLIINGYDIAGNRATCTVPVIELPDCIVYHFCPGWNMVSIPLLLDSYAQEDVWPSAEGVYTIDPATGEYVLVTGDLESGPGYLVFVTTEAWDTVCGEALESYAIELQPGWNLIGSVWGDPVSFLDPTTVPAGIIPPGHTYWYDECEVNGYIRADELVAGRGYLTFATEAGSLYVPGSRKIIIGILKDRAELTPEWTGKVTVDGKELIFGVAKEATELFDTPFDRAYPPAIDGGDAYLDRNLVVDLKGVENRIEWTLTLETASLVSFDLSGVPEDWEVALFCGEDEVSIDGAIELASGIYKLVATKLSVPVVFELSQNYPNPFNPVTKISFAVPVETNVELSVYNVLGQKVRTLANEAKKPGYYSVVWDGKDSKGESLPSGVYFYKMTADGFSSTMKMILLK